MCASCVFDLVSSFWSPLKSISAQPPHLGRTLLSFPFSFILYLAHISVSQFLCHSGPYVHHPYSSSCILRIFPRKAAQPVSPFSFIANIPNRDHPAGLFLSPTSVIFSCSYHKAVAIRVVSPTHSFATYSTKHTAVASKRIPNDLHGDLNPSPGNHGRLRYTITFQEGIRQVYCFFLFCVFLLCFALSLRLLLLLESRISLCSRKIMYFLFRNTTSNDTGLSKDFSRHISSFSELPRNPQDFRRSYRVPTRREHAFLPLRRFQKHSENQKYELLIRRPPVFGE